MRQYIIYALILSTLVGGLPSRAAVQSHCSVDLYKRAESSLVDARRSWESLRRHRINFGKCDDGGIGEGYSDAVVTFFAKDRAQLDVFVRISRRHPAFGRWAIRHIDATAAETDLKRIVRNAGGCSGDTAKKIICRSVNSAAVDALAELR